jgi:hypothetical protein
MFSIFGCISPLILLGLVLHSIRILWITLVPPSNMPKEAACGQCGYAVAGLTDPKCPECGADWRISGITTPALIMRYRGGTFGAILAWTVIMVGGGLVVLGIGSIFVGRTYVAQAAVTPQVLTTPLTPTSTTYSSVDVAASAMLTGGGGTNDVTATLTLASGAEWKFMVDPATKTCEVHDPASPGSPTVTPYKPGSVLAFYNAAGLDTTNATIAAEAAELERIIDIQLMSAFTQPSQMNLTHFTAGAPRYTGVASPTATTVGPAAWAGPAALIAMILWLIFYILGIVYIVVRRGRLMGSYSKQAVYSPGM